MAGYTSEIYAASFDEHGSPYRLPSCGGWILQRPIPGSDRLDAMGLYPLFACSNWHRLQADVDELTGALVSLAAVPDPFGGYDTDVLRRAFRDVVVPFKEHFVVDACKPLRVAAHHRYYARRAARTIKVDCHESPAEAFTQFQDAYRHLVARHGLKGMKALSPPALLAQLSVPGALLFLARCNGDVVAGQLWYLSGEVAYSHLTAMTPAGYRLRASYAVYAAAIETLRNRVRWLDLGGAAGASGNSGGLAVFKRGWTNDVRTTYFCGRILNPSAYAALAGARREPLYFPAYRRDELTSSGQDASA